MKRVLVLSDGVRERELQLVGRIVVGRDPSCEVSHDDSLLSRRHAEFVAEGDLVSVRDLGSRNGVFVNGARIAEHVLEPGDVVQIGPLRGRCASVEAPRTVEPDEMDADRTGVIRQAFAGAAGVDLDDAGAEDDDVTRMVPAPRLPVAVSGVPETPTGFIPPPVAAAARGPVATFTVDAPSGSPVSATRSSTPLRGFIFGQVTMLAALVLAAGVVSLVISGRSTADSLSWVALPALAALAGAYIVGASIAGRVADAVADAERGRR